jgi:hypothetical protein
MAELSELDENLRESIEEEPSDINPRYKQKKSLLIN